jgi:phosphatidylinositol alpha-1,6-mannosyltransferase
MKLSGSSCVGLFPGLSGMDGTGSSGLAAWRSVAGACADATVLTYGPNPPDSALPGTVLHAGTVTAAVLQALRIRRAPDLALVWHLHLLKLMPLLARPRRLAVFLHGIEAWKPLSSVEARYMKRAALILSNSEHTVRRFVEVNPAFAASRFCVVPLGLGAPRNGEVPGPAQVPSAVMLGRAVRSEDYKGHREVIQAWPKVVQSVPGAELHCVGSGDMTETLRSLAAAAGVPHLVRLHGQVPEERKLELLEQARCMALPSRGEGFGLAYIEAMRLGRPCLVSTVDAGREVVLPPRAGLAANPANPEELAQALIRLLSDGPEWREWSVQARRLYADRYTEELFRERLLAALEQC